MIGTPVELWTLSSIERIEQLEGLVGSYDVDTLHRSCNRDYHIRVGGSQITKPHLHVVDEIVIGRERAVGAQTLDLL